MRAQSSLVSLLGLVTVLGMASRGDAQTFTAIDWNVQNACQANSTCRHDEINFVAGLDPRPTVITLQETYSFVMSDWKSTLESLTGQTWTYVFAPRKIRDVNGNCTVDDTEGVAILTSWPVLASETAQFMFADTYECGRAAARAQIVVNGTAIQVFTFHATTGDAAGNVRAVRDWAVTYPNPQIVSCDCNIDADIADPIMRSNYMDAWLTVGAGAGLTWNNKGNLSVRIDYWFSDSSGGFQPVTADNPYNASSDHLPVRTTYSSNLLQRAGFEEYAPPALGTPGWVSDPARQTPAKSETNQPHTGSKNGACSTSANLDCGIYQNVTAPTTGTYILRFFANADRAGGLVGVDINGGLAVSSNVAVRGFGIYGAPYTMTFQATVGATIHVWMYSPATPGSVVIDDVAVMVTSNGPPNLLQKAGFEEYTPPALGTPGWISDTARQTPAQSETNQPHTGAKNGVCFTSTNLDCGMYQDVTAPASGTYTLTFYANADRAGGLIGADVNGSLATSSNVAVRGVGNYGAAYTMTFWASAGPTIHVWMYSPATPGSVVIDDVSLTVGP